VDPAFIDRLIGYRSDEDMAPGWRAGLKALIALSTIAIGVAMIAITHREPRPTRGNVVIVSTLDDFTQHAGPTAPNTVPAFLALPGRVGALGASADADEPVHAIDEAELERGFCTPSVTRQIRHQYPGYYESWPDDKLERLALEKYPEMRDQVCTLSYKIDATPEGIIKYELKPRTLIASGTIWLLTLLVTGAFALGGANLYYRVLVDRLATA
jgi:hypothetical protein